VTPENEDLEEAPAGEVVVTNANDAVVARGDLDDEGAVSLNLAGTKLPAGSNPLTVTYVGEGNFVEGSDSVSAPVTRAATTTRATGPNRVERNATINARVVVDQAFGTSTGVVEIYTGGDRVGRGTLSNGVVNIKITKNFPVGTRTFRARYLGTPNILASADTFSVRIVQAR
jgi:hypothetical protein